jgi:hypothetical protein
VNKIISLSANEEGKICVHRQIKDYEKQGWGFEEMGFFTFTVEMYKRRLPSWSNDTNIDVEDIDDEDHLMVDPSHYLSNHPKHTTHLRIAWPEFHNFLPNIIRPWFPCQDGNEDIKAYYYVSMLALLEPWRNIQHIKGEEEDWECVFDNFVQTATRRDRDIIAGS